MKISLLAVGLAVVAFVLPAGTHAETVSIETSMKPLGGKLYEETRVPVQSRLTVDVSVPDGQPTILPLKRTRIAFDTDMQYNPDPTVTPPCPDSKLSQASPLGSGIAGILALCPRSVIGTGSSVIYLARAKTGVLSDPQMVIFNAGRDSKGNPKMKIYGYSKQTGAGLLMEGSLDKNGIQDVPIGVLSFDSAIGHFVFDLPGAGMKIKTPEGEKIVKGLDPGYVTARCSDGLWTTGGQFFLGERNPSTGADSGPTTLVDAQPFNNACQGLPGRASLRKVSLDGPTFGSPGQEVKLRIRVANRGTATAKNLKVRASGVLNGSRRFGSIPPNVARTFVLRARVVGSSGTTSKASIDVVARGSRVSFSRPFRVR